MGRTGASPGRATLAAAACRTSNRPRKYRPTSTSFATTSPDTPPNRRPSAWAPSWRSCPPSLTGRGSGGLCNAANARGRSGARSKPSIVVFFPLATFGVLALAPALAKVAADIVLIRIPVAFHAVVEVADALLDMFAADLLL